jgi:membrane fusion protein (multidrug efflux system)
VAAQRAELKIQDYKIEAAKAEMTLASIRLEDSRLLAPQDGIVAKKNVEPGQYVVQGQQLMALTSQHELWVTANIKETDIGRVKVGQPATVTVDAYPDQPLAGVVQSLGSATGSMFSLLPQENATGNFTKVVQRVPVKIQLRDMQQQQALRLRPGMSVFVEIEAHTLGSDS